MREKVCKILHIILLVIISTIIVGAVYLAIKFPSTYFEEIVFYLRSGVGDADGSVVTSGIKTGLPFVIILTILFYALFYDIKIVRKKELNKEKDKNKKEKKKIYPFKIFNNHRILFTSILLILSIIGLLQSVRVFDYVIYTFSESKFISDNYVDPRSVNIEFGEKRNLIFIVVESLETSFFDKKHGGHWKYEVTPELYKLLNDEDAVTFYDKNKAQEMKMIQGASWTTASVVANSTGVPFKIRINKNQYHSENFMNGAYALGDLLKDNGYYNELISSAKTTFGGLKEFYTKHGDYEIVDINSLDKFGLEYNEKTDKGKWGFNDNYLFETAKKRLEVISKQEQPFNLELITIDTHFTDGFIGNYSEDKYDTQYENVYATESKLIYDFVSWVKEQDFYKDTTIVIVGDHLSMQTDFFTSRGIKDNRYVYNCIINPGVEAKNTKGRVYTALDSYPTIVNAIGGKIEGERLGLGTNLFSGEKTLAEKYKLDFLDKELQKKSDFYNDVILNDYYLDKYKLDESR